MKDDSKTWVPVKGYEKLYLVSSCGLLYSIRNKKLGINMSSLSMVLNGKRNQVGGMMFKYLEGEL